MERKLKINPEKSLYFPHLNTSTNSNLSFSLIRISQLVGWAVEKKMEHLAIADYYPYEFLKFSQLCKEKKIKPVIGVKVIVQEENDKQYLLTIYPQNSTGYKELNKKIFSGETAENRVFSVEEILPLKKNCLLVFLAHSFQDIKTLSQKTFFLAEKENQLYIGFDFFITEAKKNILPNALAFLLPFFPVKSLSAEDNTFLELLCESPLSQNFLFTDIQAKAIPYLNEEEFLPLCTNDKVLYKVLLAQVKNFLAKVSLKFGFSGKKTSQESEGKKFAELQDKCFKQLLFLGKEEREKYEKRLEEELRVINKLGYSSYFLVFKDVIDYLHQKNIIVGPGRGSAVSSLVAYLLGITKIDPLEHQLFFERFLNEKRENPPDIDIDVEKQEIVWDYLQKKYGAGKIAKIATRQKLGWKNALKETAEIIKKRKIRPLISESELKEILGFVKEDGFQENLKVKFFQTKFKFFFAMASKIKDLFFNTSLHPSGIIIAEKEPLTKTLPLKKEKDFLVSFCCKEDFNLLGLKKYDFLSLNSLRTLSKIKETLQKEHLPKCSFQDKATWKLINSCLITDVPQLDTVSFRSLLASFQPQNFPELVLLLALNRPGARQNIEVIERQRKRKQTKFFASPILNQILGESYGFIVFEEQVSQIFAFIFACSFAEGDIQRRNLPKMKKEELEVFKSNFLAAAEKKIPVIESKKLWEQIISNNNYTFNKAHAVAYAYLCYYIAYLKANYFPSLITYYLNNFPEKTSLYLQEASFYDFSFQKPDINLSEIQWSKKGKSLIMGFSSLKNYHASFFQAIIEERKKKLFRDWEDFISRTNDKWEKIELITLQKWIEVELFASLKVKSNYLLKHSEIIFRYLKLRKEFPLASRELPNLDWERKGLELSEKEDNLLINQREKENLDIYVSYFNRWKQVKNKLIDCSVMTFAEFINNLAKFNNQDNLIHIYSVIQDIQLKRDSYWLVLYDFRSVLKLLITSSFYQQNEKILKPHQEVICQLNIKVSNQQVKIIQVQKVELID